MLLVNLNLLPPAASAVKYIEYMGGADAVVAKARQDYEAGHFRWVVKALNHVVFAQPGRQAARQLSGSTSWSPGAAGHSRRG